MSIWKEVSVEVLILAGEMASNSRGAGGGRVLKMKFSVWPLIVSMISAEPPMNEGIRKVNYLLDIEVMGIGSELKVNTIFESFGSGVESANANPPIVISCPPFWSSSGMF